MRPSPGRSGFTLIELVVVVAIIAIIIGLIVPAVQRVRDSALRLACANNLKQIGLALQNYHDANRILPPGCMPNDPQNGFPLMGWQARILPYVEQGNLWGQTQEAYGLDKNPFDNPPHIGFDTVIPIYICPSDGRIRTPQYSRGYHAAFTSYLGVEGTNLLKTDGVLYSDSKVHLAEITDGTSNTLMVGERPPSADFYWGWWYAGAGQSRTGSCDMVLGVAEENAMRPVNLGCPPGPYEYGRGNINNDCDLFHFWSLHIGGAHFLFCDGAVHFLSYSASPVMPALGTRSGGEVVDQASY